MKLACIRPSLPGLAVLLLVAAPVEAQIKKSDSVVKVKAVAGKADTDGNQTVTITLDVAKPWHIYANPVGHDMLTGAQTVVKVTNKEADVKVAYPPGKTTKDTVVGDYKTYDGKVTIKAEVKRAKGDTGPLTLTVKIQACDEKSVCLLPATVKLTIE